MNVLEEIELCRGFRWTDEDGDEHSGDFFAGLSEAEIAQIESELGTALPTDLRHLLAVCSAFYGGGPETDFSGRSNGIDASDFIKHVHAIAWDGFGNFWVVDCLGTPEEEATIYYVCHDPPVFVFQCTGMATFIRDLRNFAESDIAKVMDVASMEIWSTNPNLILSKDARTSGDADLKAFAQDLGDDFLMIDMRAAKTGMGFSWGRSGPNGEVRRFGQKRIFAYRAPPQKTGMFGWLKKK